MLMKYMCNQLNPFVFSGFVSRPGLCWRCWLVCRRCCPIAPVGGVVVHEQIARHCCRVMVVSVAVRSSFVSIALLMLKAGTAYLSDAIAVARFASASACCCFMSSVTVALACPPLMQCAPYPSDTDVRGWTWISWNSCAKNSLKASHVLSTVSLLRHYFTPL